MSNEDRNCGYCIFSDVLANEEPCRNCYKFALYQPRYSEPSTETETTKFFDEHYQGDIQPIEVMQALFTPEELRGFLKGNIVKYVLRLGKKDAPEKEATKIKRYAEWLYKSVKGTKIDPREN